MVAVYFDIYYHIIIHLIKCNDFITNRYAIIRRTVFIGCGNNKIAALAISPPIALPIIIINCHRHLKVNIGCAIIDSHIKSF